MAGETRADKTLVIGVEGEDEKWVLLRLSIVKSDSSDSLGVVCLSFKDEGVDSFWRYSFARSSSEKSPSTSLVVVLDGRILDGDKTVFSFDGEPRIHLFV